MGRGVVREEEKREGQERGLGVKNGGPREEKEETIQWQGACSNGRIDYECHPSPCGTQAAKEAAKNSFEDTPVTQV